MRKVSSELEKEIKQLRAERSGLNKAQGLKKGKASFELEKEIKQLMTESSRPKQRKKRDPGSKRK